ncbi:hypothetical protein H5410_020209 [Solanum commersonii]|uniref:Uncharacterized protein n=1 Tax=Solanum commersonii TaxID=4109 RepID=A0A9J5ZAK1_SOLCO|nr:hypothetical protein H5410_020209 [Solanum commersonii]
MDPTINTVASSEMIPTSSIAANPSASIATESPMEVIARLERQIGELNLLVAQFQAASQNLPPDARQKGPMPPSASLTHSTHDTPPVYTFTPPKVPTITHHTPPVYTYVTALPVTKAQQFHRQDFANRAYQTGSFRKKKEKEVMMLTTQGAISYNRQPPPRYPNSQYYVCNNQATFHPPRLMQNHRNNAPHPSFEKKPPRVSLPELKPRIQRYFELLNVQIRYSPEKWQEPTFFKFHHERFPTLRIQSTI